MKYLITHRIEIEPVDFSMLVTRIFSAPLSVGCSVTIEVVPNKEMFRDGKQSSKLEAFEIDNAVQPQFRLFIVFPTLVVRHGHDLLHASK